MREEGMHFEVKAVQMPKQEPTPIDCMGQASGFAHQATQLFEHVRYHGGRVHELRTEEFALIMEKDLKQALNALKPVLKRAKERTRGRA